MARSVTLLRTLGRGAHGSVHLGELRDDDDFVQMVAIKRLLPDGGLDRQLAARLRDEARLLALLRHENIVRVQGLTQVDGDLAILMEVVDGVDLGRLVADGPLPPRAATEIVLAVADALDAAWTARPGRQLRPLRVVHRDIKPSNVMVTPRGGVKVMDFGVARATFDAREAETRSQHLGTARFMAPERWLHGTAGHASDVFSLGVTYLELLSGVPAQRPRLSEEAFADDMAEQLARVEQPALHALLEDMCAYVPSRRPSAAEVALRARSALAELRAGPTLREWARASVVPSEGESLDPTVPATLIAGSTWGSRPRRGWLVASVAVPVVLAAVAAVALVMPGPQALPERAAVPSPTEATVPAPPPSPAKAERAEAAPPSPRPMPERAERAPGPTKATDPAEPSSPTDDVELVVTRFLLAPGLTVETDWGRVQTSPAVLSLPAHKVVELRVREGEETWSCAIAVGGMADDVYVEGRSEGGCHR